MYTNERRRVAQFCHIRRRRPRPNHENILGIGDNSLSRTAQNLTVNYHQCRTCIEQTDW